MIWHHHKGVAKPWGKAPHMWQFVRDHGGNSNLPCNSHSGLIAKQVHLGRWLGKGMWPKMVQVIEFIMNTTGITSSICTSLSRQKMMAIYGNNWQYIYIYIYLSIYLSIYMYNLIYIYWQAASKTRQWPRGRSPGPNSPWHQLRNPGLPACPVWAKERELQSSPAWQDVPSHFLGRSRKAKSIWSTAPPVNQIVWAHFYRIHRPNFKSNLLEQ